MGLKLEELRVINNLRFADDIDLLTETKEQLRQFTKKVNSTALSHGMEITAKKSKLMVTSKATVIISQPIKIGDKRCRLEYELNLEFKLFTLEALKLKM